MLNQEEITALNKLHGQTYTLHIPLNDELTEHATMYLKKITRPVYEIVVKALQKSELDAATIMINSLWVGGDPATSITENFDALRSATMALVPMLTARTGELKKN